jgi:hypothetical protein
MTKKPFTGIAAGLLSVVALVQLLRLAQGWEVTIGGVSIPIWASAVAVVVAAGLAAMLWIEMRR